MMMGTFLLFAQNGTNLSPEQVLEVVSKASAVSWEAGALATIMFGMAGLMVYLVKSWMNQSETREARMASRIDKLEENESRNLVSQREEMRILFIGCQKTIDANTQALQRIMDVLGERPCLVDIEQQHAILMQRAQKGGI